MATVTICSDFGAQENKACHCFHCFPSICHEVMGLDAMILVFWMLSFKPTFSLSTFTFTKRLFSSLLSAKGWCHLHIWGYWYFSLKSWFQLVLKSINIISILIINSPTSTTFLSSSLLLIPSSKIDQVYQDSESAVLIHFSLFFTLSCILISFHEQLSFYVCYENLS